MLNNKHAVDFFYKIEGRFHKVESTYEKASRKNGNLRAPSKSGPQRNQLYVHIDELSPEEYFGRELHCPKVLKNRIKALIPEKIRLFVKILKTYVYSC